MNYYIITFDLHLNIDEINECYSKIEEYLKTFDKYVKPTNNVYLVASNTIQNTEIRRNIKELCSNNGFILVMDVNGSYASYNLDDINQQLADFFS